MSVPSLGEVLTVAVPSQSDPKLTYTMHVRGDEITCSCRGFNTHSHCYHQDALRRVFREEHMNNESESTTAIATREAELPTIISAQPPPTALLPTRGDLEAMALIAGQAIKATGMIPAAIKTKEQALAVMIAGWELGLRPMTALRHVYVVNGKTEIETRAMVGIIRARDPRITFKWPEYTQEAVTCEIHRPGQPVTSVRYTKADAEKSGQMAKAGPWKSYTRDMLYAAATKRACRLGAPDLINAIESGLKHTVSEAESLMMPPADVRVIDPLADAPADAPAEIPADAEYYNDGDDPGGVAEGITAEQEVAAVEQAPKLRLATWLREQRGALDQAQFETIVKGINTAYPGALVPRTGEQKIPGVLTDEQALAILDGLSAPVQGALDA